jgi:hypothetical protein
VPVHSCTSAPLCFGFLFARGELGVGGGDGVLKAFQCALETGRLRESTSVSTTSGATSMASVPCLGVASLFSGIDFLDGFDVSVEFVFEMNSELSNQES